MFEQNSPEVWSFFTGAMGLDLGLEQGGVRVTLANEVDSRCCGTITLNRPELQLVDEPIEALTVDSLRATRRFDGDVYMMVGGPPCQTFSSGGKRASLTDPRGNLIYEYLRLVGEIRPQYFVFENVANLTTAALRHRPIAQRPGKRWSLKHYDGAPGGKDGDAPPLEPDELSGSAIRKILADVKHLHYAVAFGVLDAADYGTPQHRLRFIMVGAREGAAPVLPGATHGLPGSDLHPFRTVREAIFDLHQSPGPGSEYTPRVRRYFSLVPTGGNWRDLPVELQREALGGSWAAGGGKTGFYRRLPWDAPSPTIIARANRKGSALCHPEAVRPISVREAAALQGFPPDWEFTGSMNAQYQQVGNAVPVPLGKAIAEALACGPRHAVAPESVDFDAMLVASVARLRSAARNKRRTMNGTTV